MPKKDAKMAAVPGPPRHPGKLLVDATEQSGIYLHHLVRRMQDVAAGFEGASAAARSAANAITDMQVAIAEYDRLMAEEHAKRPDPRWRRK